MKAELEKKTVSAIVNLSKNKMITVNAEYQRGPVWNEIQKQKLVDSLLRGYPIPMLYLHHIKREIEGMVREDLEVVDGQQRINALFEYSEGAFPLLDPQDKANASRFPRFVRSEPCEWAGLRYKELPQTIKDRFNGTLLAVEYITTESENEVRDLFLRLQSGLPLNAQETRDAWPGQFTDFVMSLGGKFGIARFPGHPFFSELLSLRTKADRGKARQLAAQICLLFFSRRSDEAARFVDIDAASINEFYSTNVDFDSDGADAKRLNKILHKANELLSTRKGPRLRGHDAIHLVLLLDALWDDYTRSWEDKLSSAVDEFQNEFALAKKANKQGVPDEAWIQYGQLTRSQTDRAAVIGKRHQYYLRRMKELLGPLVMKDATRLFGEVDRQVLYYAQNGRCAVCGATMNFSEVEVHHIVEHSKGGGTTLDNGAAVHSHCHPKGAAATKAFAEKEG